MGTELKCIGTFFCIHLQVLFAENDFNNVMSFVVTKPMI